MANQDSAIAHQFEDAQQQRQAAELGMWGFLATEFMFFGGLFAAYLVYRFWYPTAFAAASATMDFMLGTINTGVLLTSSLSMALAVDAAQNSRRQRLIVLLLATIALGLLFLCIKAHEYHHKYVEGHIPFGGLSFLWADVNRDGAIEFFNLYFLMTGLHALHMVIGVGLLSTLVVMAWRGGLLAERSVVAHNVGLYWHFVDLVWVYLFPFFYLVSARAAEIHGG